MVNIDYPSFDKKEPKVWFIRLEAILAVHGIKNDEEMFAYAVAGLPDYVLTNFFVGVNKISESTKVNKYQQLKKNCISSSSFL